MAFDLQRFVALRPFAYHVTHGANVPRLRRVQRLLCAAELMRLAGEHHWLRKRRTTTLQLVVGGEAVALTDQKPLIMANAALEGGWDEGDYVAHLNENVYFWPGDSDSLLGRGPDFMNAAKTRRPVLLRAPTADLLAANTGREPLFCAFNSGSPRKNLGAPIPRGPDLFLAASNFPRRAFEVVELVFWGTAMLPGTTELSLEPGVWTALSAPGLPSGSSCLRV